MSEEYRMLWCSVCQAMTEHEDGQCMRDHPVNDMLDDIDVIIEEDEDD